MLEFLSQLFGLGEVPTSARCLVTVDVNLLPLAGVFFGFVGRGSCNVVRDLVTVLSRPPVPASGLGSTFLPNASSIFLLFAALRRSIRAVNLR